MKYWYMPQCEWTSKTCKVKEARHRRPCIIWFLLYEISRIDKSIATGDQWLPGAGGKEEWGVTA